MVLLIQILFLCDPLNYIIIYLFFCCLFIAYLSHLSLCFKYSS